MKNKDMKKVLFFLLAIMPPALMAQVNEMFYVPQKSTKQVSVAKSTDDEWGVADNGNSRDVDEYNRRGGTSIAANDVESLLQEEYSDESDYDYSTRIVRFHNPTTVVVSSPWYYDVYPYGAYYDSSWGWSIGCGLGWGLSAGWYWPHYSHHHWACAPTPPYHHHKPAWGGAHRVQARVPSVSVTGRGNGGGRRPVGSVSAAGDKRPVVQSGKTGKEQKASSSNVKKSDSKSKRERVNRGGSSRRSDNGSTYNRRSSTSVRAGGSVNVRSSSGSRSRSSVGGAARSSSSRGGSARGGRR